MDYPQAVAHLRRRQARMDETVRARDFPRWTVTDYTALYLVLQHIFEENSRAWPGPLYSEDTSQDAPCAGARAPSA